MSMPRAAGASTGIFQSELAFYAPALFAQSCVFLPFVMSSFTEAVVCLFANKMVNQLGHDSSSVALHEAEAANACTYVALSQAPIAHADG